MFKIFYYFARKKCQQDRNEHTKSVAEKTMQFHVSPEPSVSLRILFSTSLASLSFSSHKKRHLVQTITPVSGAIGHQQRVKAAAITNSDSLIPFIPSRAPSFSFHRSFPHHPFIPSTLSLIFPFRSLIRFSRFLTRLCLAAHRSHLHLPTTLVKVTL